MYIHFDNFIKTYNLNCEYINYTEEELVIMNYIAETKNIIFTNNSNILNFIGMIYQYYEKNIKIAKEYYLKAIELNNKLAFNNYAYLLYKENKKEEAKEYYLKAIELGNINAMVWYAYILHMENKIEESIKYYLKAIELNNNYALKNYLVINQSNLKKYNDLSNIKSDITKDVLIELEKDRDILIYKNKIKNYSKLDECNICLDDNLKINIPLNCLNHLVCIDCYIKLYNDKCPFCRL